jgi:hypothetical protein
MFTLNRNVGMERMITGNVYEGNRIKGKECEGTG